MKNFKGTVFYSVVGWPYQCRVSGDTPDACVASLAHKFAGIDDAHFEGVHVTDPRGDKVPVDHREFMLAVDQYRKEFAVEACIECGDWAAARFWEGNPPTETPDNDDLPF